MKNVLFLFLFLIFLMFVTPINTIAGQSSPAKPSPLQKCKLTKSFELGVWDDIFVFNDMDNIILLRGDTLFSLSIIDSAKPVELIKSPYLANAKIVDCVILDEKLWVFLNSTKTTPFAIEVNSGEISWFKIPNLKVPGEKTPEIQSYVTVKYADAAILMISGGDQNTWPRDGNRPVYFWIDLQTGKVVRFPIGWDLEYFSMDQKIAIFAKPQEKPFQARPLQAVNLETGTFIDSNYDRCKEPFIPFDWTETENLKRIYIWHPKTGCQWHFVGILLKGHNLSFDLPLKKHHCFSTPKAMGEFVGFRTKRSGYSIMYPGRFWLLKFEQHQKPQLIATNVTEFVMLDNGNSIYTISKHNSKRKYSEAFFHDYNNNADRNILDNITGMPELDKNTAKIFEDEQTVRLINSFGSKNKKSLALCIFTHKRIDKRDFSFSAFPKHTTLRQSIVVTSEGKRFIAALFDEKHQPDKIWLHNSGKVLTGNYLWDSSNKITERKIQLSEFTLQFK